MSCSPFFKYIVMTFPSFLLTGPTAEIPLAPLQYPTLNLLPAIEVLRTSAKKPATQKNTAKEDDVKIEGTVGMVEQWQNEYDVAKNKMSKILKVKGEDAYNDPNFKMLASTINRLESPYVKNTLKKYNDDLQSLKANVNKEGANDEVSLEILALSGKGKTWQEHINEQEHSYATEIGDVDREDRLYLKNMPTSSKFHTYTKAVNEIKSLYAASAADSTKISNAKSGFQEYFTENMGGLVNSYNSSFTDYKSNKMKMSADGVKIMGGQLQAARDFALQKAMQDNPFMIDNSDVITGGLMQGFLQKTLGITKNKKPGELPEKNVFLNRYDNGFKEEDLKDIEKSHDGYYYKEGTKDENGNDVSGQLDLNLLQTSWSNFVGHTLEGLFGVYEYEDLSTGTDFKQTFTNMNTEQTLAYANKKQIAMAAAGALQSTVSVAATADQGFSEDDLSKLLSDDTDGESEGIMGTIEGAWNWLTGNKPIASDVVSDATSGANSPFEAIMDSEENVRYIPKDPDNWDVELYRLEYLNKLKEAHPDWTDNDRIKQADKIINSVTKLYNNSRQQRYISSGFGVERIDANEYNWTSGAAQAFGILDVLNDAWFTGTGEKRTGKKASEALKQTDIKLGDTPMHGADLGNIKILSVSGDLSLSATSLADNAGFRVNDKNGIMIGGKKYYNNQFVHMKELDALDEESLKALMPSIYIGSGYWQKTDKGWIDGALPNRTKVHGMGKNSENVLNLLYGFEKANPQNAINSPAQYTSTVTFTGRKSEAIKDLEKLSFMKDVPAYAAIPKGMAVYEEAEKIFTNQQRNIDASNKKTVITPAGTTLNNLYSSTIPPAENMADDLGLQGRNRSNFISEYDNAKGSANKKAVAGKYLGTQKNIQVDWNMRPSLISTPIVKNGVIDQSWKNQVNYQESGGEPGGIFSSADPDITFVGQANVTGALQAAKQKTSDVIIETKKHYYSRYNDKTVGPKKGANYEILKPSK